MAKTKKSLSKDLKDKTKKKEGKTSRQRQSSPTLSLTLPSPKSSKGRNRRLSAFAANLKCRADTTQGHKRSPTDTTWGHKRSPADTTQGHKRSPADTKRGHKRSPADTPQGHKQSPADTTQGHKRSPADTTQGHKRSPADTTQGHKRSPADTKRGHKRSAADTPQGHKQSPADTTQGHKRSPADTTQGHKRSPADTKRGHKRSPADTKRGHKRSPADTPQGHKQSPADTTQGHKRSPADTAQGHKRSPADTTHGHKRSPADTTQGHKRSPADTTQGHKRSPADTTLGQKRSRADTKQGHKRSPSKESRTVKKRKTSSKSDKERQMSNGGNQISSDNDDSAKFTKKCKESLKDENVRKTHGEQVDRSRSGTSQIENVEDKIAWPVDEDLIERESTYVNGNQVHPSRISDWKRKMRRSRRRRNVSYKKAFNARYGVVKDFGMTVNENSDGSTDKVIPSSSRSGSDSVNKGEVSLEQDGDIEAEMIVTEDEAIFVPEETNDLDEEEDVDQEEDVQERSDFVPASTVDSALVLNTTCGAQILILKAKQEISVQGKCRVKTLCGVTSVLGYTLKSNTFYKIFSPNSSSLLTIKALHHEPSRFKVQSLYKKLSDSLDDEDTLKLYKFQSKDVAVLRIENFHNGAIEYISSLPSYQQLFGYWKGRMPSKSSSTTRISYKTFNVGSDNPNPLVMEADGYTYNRALQVWADALIKENWTGGKAPVIILCGSKNSGKSTLCRFLINTTLNKCDSVMYLECDVGQTEFTPSGCVSLHRIENPVLGPAYCHQMEPEYACFHGRISSDKDPEHYLQCIEKCYGHYDTERRTTPLIINTCGWVTGFGLDLLVDTIRLVNPDIVIQLNVNVRSKKINPPPLTSDWVRLHKSWRNMEGYNYKTVNPTKHKLLVLNSFLDDIPYSKVNAMSLRPSDYRNISLLSYLGKDLDIGMTLKAVTPYKIHWKAIAICVCHEVISPDNIPAAINASVVALCHTDLSQVERKGEDEFLLLQTLPVCRFLGFGLVRGIDIEKKHIYIITPLSFKKLSMVNLLVKGAVNLPEEVLLTQGKDEVPYVNNTVLSIGAGSLYQRRNMPRKRDST